MKKLDLGGTACYEDPDAIIISLDGSGGDDFITPTIMGSYNNMPYIPDEYFDEAVGSCYLENSMPNFMELWRVLKPGAKVYIKACDSGYAAQEVMERHMIEGGFVILERGTIVDEEYGFDNPYILQKPEQPS
jgi:hypothetical protein